MTSTNGNCVSNINTYNLFFISFSKLIPHRLLYEIPVDCRRYDFLWFRFWHLEVQLTGAGSRSQRGLEFPSAEVGRWSLKDEGDRQGDKHGPLSIWGPLGVTLFRSLSVVCLGRSLAFSRFFLALCVGSSAGLKSVFGFYDWVPTYSFQGHISLSIISWYLGHGWLMQVLVSNAQWCAEDAIPVLFVCFLKLHLELKLELKRGWMRLHVNLRCSPLVTTLTQIGSIYSDSCAQLAVAPLCSTGGLSFGLPFEKMIHPVTLKSG